MEHLDQEAPGLVSYLREDQEAPAILTNEDNEAPWTGSTCPNVPEYHGKSLNEENEAPVLGSTSYVCMGPDITWSNLCCCWDHTVKAQQDPGARLLQKPK